jgi:hypothetical protein
MNSQSGARRPETAVPDYKPTGREGKRRLCSEYPHLNSERVFDAAFLKSTKLFVDIPESKNRARTAHRAPSKLTAHTDSQGVILVDKVW